MHSGSSLATAKGKEAWKWERSLLARWGIATTCSQTAQSCHSSTSNQGRLRSGVLETATCLGKLYELKKTTNPEWCCISERIKSLLMFGLQRITRDTLTVGMEPSPLHPFIQYVSCAVGGGCASTLCSCSTNTSVPWAWHSGAPSTKPLRT